MLPKAVQGVVEAFSRLPGIGPKSAERLAFHLLKNDQHDLDEFSRAIEYIKKSTKFCKRCQHICESEICGICNNENRSGAIICVVEQSLDVYAIEKTGEYRGVYHVLHGLLSPIDNIGPKDIKMDELLARVDENTEELILATNPTPRGEATALYIIQKLNNPRIKISHLAQGIPLGGEIEYADFETLSRALKGRVDY